MESKEERARRLHRARSKRWRDRNKKQAIASTRKAEAKREDYYKAQRHRYYMANRERLLKKVKENDSSL